MNLIQITIISTKGKNHLEDMVKPLQSTKESKIHYWVEQSQEQQNYLGSFPRPIIHITVIQVYAPITDAKEAEVDPFYEDLQHLLELTPKKMSFSSQGIRMQKQEVRHAQLSCSHVRLSVDSMDCTPLGSSVPGIFQGRILEWVAISQFRGSS